MNISQIYRKRIIPAECLLLKDDIIVKQDDELVITKWNTLNPKTSFSHGCSCYFLKEGLKLSKFYRNDDSLLYWYCDIVEYEYRPEDNSLTSLDLLADVIICPDGFVKVIDLDELAIAMDKGTLSEELLKKCLFRLNKLLQIIYRGDFLLLQKYIDEAESAIDING